MIDIPIYSCKLSNERVPSERKERYCTLLDINPKLSHQDLPRNSFIDLSSKVRSGNDDMRSGGGAVKYIGVGVDRDFH